MLVHVTRWTDVQGTVARQIEEHLRSMADAWGDLAALPDETCTEDCAPSGTTITSRPTPSWKAATT